MINVRAATAADEPRWRELWAGYNAFYEAKVPESITQATWRRILDPAAPMVGRVATVEGRAVGFSNSVLHESTWAVTPVCYLEDLFTLESVRGQGVASALIEAVYGCAREAGVDSVYWQTHQSNAVAMRLYDKLATRFGFIVYDKVL